MIVCCLQSRDFLLKFDVIDVRCEQFKELGQIGSYVSAIPGEMESRLGRAIERTPADAKKK